MGDAESGPIRLSFNPQLRVEFRGATVTSDAGLLLPRELDERLGLDALIFWATTRAMMSLPPPGGNGTTSRICLAGYSWAGTGAAKQASVSANAIERFMVSSSFFS